MKSATKWLCIYWRYTPIILTMDVNRLLTSNFTF